MREGNARGGGVHSRRAPDRQVPRRHHSGTPEQPADQGTSAPQPGAAVVRAAGADRPADRPCAARYRWDAVLGRLMAATPLTVRIDLDADCGTPMATLTITRGLPG